MISKAKTNNFEETFNALQTVVEKLESDEISLEDAVKAYEEGMQMIRQCTTILEKAQIRIEQLSKDDVGQFNLEDISSSLKE
ncbi:exodeoxyribonuclease VII small subunit [candidate division KSB1 bacterium]|nr:exodeoxyribonuclease VII small subunit [candidate division KSB1 bacterium]